MKKFTRIIKLVAVNIVVTLVLLELIAVLIYLFNQGAFFYTHDRKFKPLIAPAASKRQITDKRFHPFFGYTHAVSGGGTNNYGFPCAYDFPVKKRDPGQVLVGIFGGSVAEGFYLEGRGHLTRRLQRHPRYAGKEFIYLNFAMGGYKQPQQLQILSYFLAAGQQLDLVLNIDGFNEVVFAFNNSRLNIDIHMPSAQHFLPMRDVVESSAMTEEKLEATWNIRDLKGRYQNNIHAMEETIWASKYLVLKGVNKIIYRRYRAALVRFDQLTKPVRAGKTDSIINIKHTPAAENRARLIADTAGLWFRGSFNMARLAEGGGGAYYHFLQPNQYFSGKTFTPEERANALDTSLPYGGFVKEGYPLLEKAVELLRKRGVNVFSAAAIFDKVAETLYTDTCCHFNPRGNQILAEFIAGCILKDKVKAKGAR